MTTNIPRDEIESARRSIAALGADSAPARAVAEYDRLVTAGLQPYALQSQGTWFVVTEREAASAEPDSRPPRPGAASA